MTHVSTTGPVIIDTARHPLNDGLEAAGRATAEGATRRLVPSASTIVRDAPRAALEAAVLVSFIASVLIWAEAIFGRD